MSNVFSFVAEETGYRNLHVPDDKIPLTNLTGTIPGPLNSNPNLVTPFPPANRHAVGAGGGPVFIAH
jgi:hypothetical protein